VDEEKRERGENDEETLKMKIGEASSELENRVFSV